MRVSGMARYVLELHGPPPVLLKDIQPGDEVELEEVLGQVYAVTVTIGQCHTTGQPFEGMCQRLEVDFDE